MEQLNNRNNRTIYCHFSFKRPKGKDYGLFAVAFYNDFEGKKVVTHTTKRLSLWKDHQFVTGIQAYENALASIYRYQGDMKRAGISRVLLVTDNSTLAGWIDDPKKNKNYTEYMQLAVKNYRVGAPKEIILDVGLCEVRDYEKSYKYCKEEFVVNDKAPAVEKKSNGRYVIDLEASNMSYSTITDVIKSSPMSVEIEGMDEN